MYQDPTLETLQRRGVVFLLCHTGAAEQARVLASGSAAGTTAEGVLHDLLSHVRHGVLVVPSAVATIGLLQSRFNYSYTAVTA
jgi:hypothetical protein